ncbi:hypothetical protein NDU88_006201 [Pleurodeles waltl]|uniref:Uncharacterized protein n=1 Tax=Pleurodeles waltl TaxID=8319 RepID=A0AAV7RNV7_PLEWA|nr:hypothetical protein NDU88_006201 [Pleurodeles waltl]
MSGGSEEAGRGDTRRKRNDACGGVKRQTNGTSEVQGAILRREAIGLHSPHPSSSSPVSRRACTPRAAGGAAGGSPPLDVSRAPTAAAPESGELRRSLRSRIRRPWSAGARSAAAPRPPGEADNAQGRLASRDSRRAGSVQRTRSVGETWGKLVAATWAPRPDCGCCWPRCVEGRRAHSPPPPQVRDVSPAPS